MKDEHVHKAWKKFKNKDKDKDKKAVKEEMEDFGETMENEEITVGERHSKHKRVKPKLLEEEVTINFKIKPMRLIKWALVIILLICFFLLGRLSVGCDAETTTSTVEVAEEAKVADEDSSIVSSVSGFFTGLFSDSAGGGTPTGGSTVENNTTQDETDIENSTETVSEETEEAIVVEEAAVAEESDEDVVTSYTNVALAITDVDINWKGTWGKIEKFKYTIKNNEVGTVKPDHFVMVMEGYDDFEKSVSLTSSSKIVKSKTAVSSTATIPSGFSYNELTTGDLSNVDVTITLYDADDKVMTSFKKGFDLQG
jgi:hypothetical protein